MRRVCLDARVVALSTQCVLYHHLQCRFCGQGSTRPRLCLSFRPMHRSPALHCFKNSFVLVACRSVRLRIGASFLAPREAAADALLQTSSRLLRRVKPLEGDVSVSCRHARRLQQRQLDSKRPWPSKSPLNSARTSPAKSMRPPSSNPSLNISSQKSNQPLPTV